MRYFYAFIGLVVMAGSAAAWHFWHINGVLACIIAFCGLSLIGYSGETKQA
jgi:hypothetical protein